VDVLLDRPLTQTEFAGDFFIRQAASDHERDLAFARA
jgi:hypothetical protein